MLKSKVITLPLSSIDTTQFENSRCDLEGDGWQAFLADIKAKGIINKPTVRASQVASGPRKGEVDYQLIAGFRRVHAATCLEFGSIDVVCYEELSDTDARAINLVENLQRKELHWTEVAWGFGELSKDEKNTPGRIASLVGASKPHVTTHLQVANSGFFSDALRRHNEGEPNLPFNLALEVAKAAIKEEAGTAKAKSMYVAAVEEYLNPKKDDGDDDGDDESDGGEGESPIKKVKFTESPRKVKEYLDGVKASAKDASGESAVRHEAVIATLRWLLHASVKAPIAIQQEEPTKKTGGRKSAKAKAQEAGA